jgi:hypothetical protein
MKKKVGPLAAALNGQGGHRKSGSQAKEEAKGGLGNSPQAQPQGSETLKKNQCAFCCQEGGTLEK